MSKTVVEVGFLLDIGKEKCADILQRAGAEGTAAFEVRDIYFTNKSDAELEAMTENQIKKACVRFRMGKRIDDDKKRGEPKNGTFDNYTIFDGGLDDKFECTLKKFKKFKEAFTKSGWRIVFDTKKSDFHFKIGDMKSRIQVQDIDDVGLVLYYDNPDYYEMDEDAQRYMLIRELNSYGFDFDENDLGVDKLRTLLTGSFQYSQNQNG